MENGGDYGENEASEMDVQPSTGANTSTPQGSEGRNGVQVIVFQGSPLLPWALGLVFKGSNTNGKIWIFVEEGTDFDVDVYSEQTLHGRFSSARLANFIAIMAVYAKCTRLGRYAPWDITRDLTRNLDGSPWIVGGDFNAILSAGDRVGSDTNRQAEMIDFCRSYRRLQTS